jgi:hypothetical protein
MTPEREALVRSTWSRFEPRASDHARFFYDKLFELDPECRRMFSTATMESRRCPGLFVVGEILDVDGRLGGFNFQWAWSSARVAARGLAARFERS